MWVLLKSKPGSTRSWVQEVIPESRSEGARKGREMGRWKSQSEVHQQGHCHVQWRFGPLGLWRIIEDTSPKSSSWKVGGWSIPLASSHHQMRTSSRVVTPSHFNLYLPGRRCRGRVCLRWGAGSTWWVMTHIYLSTTAVVSIRCGPREDDAGTRSIYCIKNFCLSSRI